MSFFMIAILFIIQCCTSHASESAIDLEFIVPGSKQTLSTTLSMYAPDGVSFHKVLRSVLYINSIVMDCSFHFDTSSLSSNKLVCDTSNACISSAHSNPSTKLHLENLGIGDLSIVKIKKDNEMMFYDRLLCIGDSSACQSGRFIDFVLDASSQTMTEFAADAHPILEACDPKDTVYDALVVEKKVNTKEIKIEEEVTRGSQSRGSRRKLMAIHGDIYGDSNYHNSFQIVPQTHYYMDIVVTSTFVILILISMLNMSYAFNYYKSTTGKRPVFDTRRV